MTHNESMRKYRSNKKELRATVSIEEFEKAKQLANKAGLCLAEFIRNKVFGKRK